MSFMSLQYNKYEKIYFLNNGKIITNTNIE